MYKTDSSVHSTETIAAIYFVIKKNIPDKYSILYYPTHPRYHLRRG